MYILTIQTKNQGESSVMCRVERKFSTNTTFVESPTFKMSSNRKGKNYSPFQGPLFN